MIPNLTADHGVAPRSAGRTGARYPSVKRLLDVTLAFIGVVLLAPLFALVALLVRLDSRGPVLHRRRVVARQSLDLNGGGGPLRTFDAFKFRTMVADADDILLTDEAFRRAFEVNYKLAADPRVTRVGQVLRRTCLDELPQLLNVLRGEMSLVGPRIVTPPELERYGEHAGLLLSVTPGMTGLWQISERASPSYPERVRLDREYIARRSLRLDLALLARTVLWLFSPRR